MKKILAAAVIAVVLYGCSGGNYKKKAISYLKEKLKVDNIDTIKFLKPDSIATNFRDAGEYRSLMRAIYRAQDDGDSTLSKKLQATLLQRLKTQKKKLVGWDVTLIYKAKNKKGVLQTDTCRFMFDDRKAKVLDVNDVSL